MSRSGELSTIPPSIALPAPPIPSPPNILTVGPPHVEGVAQSGLVNGELTPCGTSILISPSAFWTFISPMTLSYVFCKSNDPSAP